MPGANTYWYVHNNGDCNDSNASIHSPQTWYRDADGDGYGDPSVTTSACSQPAGYVANNTDCYDGNASIWQILIGYWDADSDGYGGGSIICLDSSHRSLSSLLIKPALASTMCKGYPESICSGASLPARYANNNTDCNDSNASVWQMLNGYRDADGDGYGDMNYNVLCLNNSNHSLTNLFIKPALASGSCHPYSTPTCSGSSLPAGWSSNYTDCYDSNANVHPGQTSYFGDSYGGGSFDWDCSGSVEKNPATNYFHTTGSLGAIGSMRYGTCQSSNTSQCYQTNGYAGCGEMGFGSWCSTLTYYASSNCSGSSYGCCSYPIGTVTCR
jgi:hypothetical protein